MNLWFRKPTLALVLVSLSVVLILSPPQVLATDLQI